MTSIKRSKTILLFLILVIRQKLIVNTISIVNLSVYIFVSIAEFNTVRKITPKQKLLYGKHSNLPLFSLISFNQFN